MAKQLSLSERIIIEQMIHKDYSFASIGRNLIGLLPLLLAKYYIIVVSRAEFLSWVKTTVLIVLVVSAIPFVPRKDFAVVTFSRCKRCSEGIICTEICDSYDSFQCDLLDKPPYVCSNCKMQKSCKKNKAYYSAHKANAAHHKSIKRCSQWCS